MVEVIKQRVCSLQLHFSAHVCAHIGSGQNRAQDAAVEKAWLEWSIWMTLVSTVVQVALCLFAGALADRFGRRPVVIFSGIGYSIFCSLQ